MSAGKPRRPILRNDLIKLVGRPAVVIPPPLVHPSGKTIINFTLGDPIKADPRTFTTPRHILDAVATANDPGAYTAPRGNPNLLPLLERDLGTSHLLVTNGASEGMEKLMHALAGHVLIPSPCFPPYIDHHEYHGKPVRFYRVDPQTGPDLEHLRSSIREDTAAILIINPNNPMGMAYGREILEAIIRIAEESGVFIIADEVYHEMTFGEPPPKMRELTRDVPIVEIFSLSKRYLMCGHRIGGLAFHNITPELEELETILLRMCSTRLCANTLGQIAAVAALQGGDAHLREVVPVLKERATAMVSALRRIPNVKIVEPKAAFYLWWGIAGTRFTSDIEFVKALTDEEAVYMFPGSGFGYRPPEEDRTLWFRTVFLPPIEQIREGINRIENFVTGRE